MYILFVGSMIRSGIPGGAADGELQAAHLTIQGTGMSKHRYLETNLVHSKLVVDPLPWMVPNWGYLMAFGSCHAANSGELTGFETCLDNYWPVLGG
jgi:hypothetical protein